MLATMPSKNRSGRSAPSKHPARSNSSRGVDKRARAKYQEGDNQILSKAGAHEDSNQTNEALVGNATRLKKKRLNEPLGESLKEEEGEADRRENVASLSAAIQSVANRCEQQIQHILQNRAIMRPKLDLIHDIVFVLQKASAVKVLTSVPNLPKILFIATRMGVEEGENGSGGATRAVVEALIHIAKIQTEDLPTFSSKKRRVRSAFVDDVYVDYTEMQIETVKKAGQWALELLSNCVRGVSDATGGSQHDNHRNQLQHADMSELFVLPRDKLDHLLAGRLIESSALSLRKATFVKQNPAEVWRCSKLSDTQLTLALSHPLCSSLLDQLLLIAERTYTSCVKCSSVKEQLDFLTKVGQGVIDAGEEAFLALTPRSQMILLRHCKSVWLWHRHSVELALLSSDRFSSSDTHRICAPIANLIACDVAFHWDLMDEVLKDISRKSEPFNLLSWRLRPFYRAVFAEALCLIRSETVSRDYEGLSHISIVPLSKRFPTFFRSVVGFLATADKCFALFERTPEDASKTAVMTLKILQRFLRGRCGTYQISVSTQAFLLCVEGILERISWMCAVEVVKTLSREASSGNEWKKVIEDMAVVICCIEVFRLPGGGSAETDATINRRIREVRLFILDAVVHKCVMVSRKPERPRVNGLLAFWLSGLVSAGGSSGFSGAVDFLDRLEVLEILRSLKLVSNWCTSGLSRERCNMVFKTLEKLIQKQ
ncbi:hypothetical protein FGB62_14g246 [Gracilaria domingensis]|nr:hypothetical protein FGB62_14g246 [Gracilaria domingensis]